MPIPKFVKYVYVLLLFSIVLTLSCKKSSSPAASTYQITGLWIGTYTAQNPVQAPQFFSLSIFPDGSISYKSKSANGYINYANGAWTLSANTLNFTVTTLNNPIGSQTTQTASASFSSSGTLTNGNIIDNVTGTTAIWSMNRIN
jgi:hypothetical protein